jgi:hypothetical protein
MARPRKEQRERRSRVLGVRLTDTECAALQAAAEARRVPPSDLLRAAYFEASTGAARRIGSPALLAALPPALDPAAIAALNRVGANLNQLARRANSGDSFQPAEVPRVLADLSDALTRIEALVMPAID